MPFLGILHSVFFKEKYILSGRTGPEWLMGSVENSEIPMNLNGHPIDLNIMCNGGQTAEECLKEITKRKIKMFDFVSLYPSQ